MGEICDTVEPLKGKADDDDADDGDERNPYARCEGRPYEAPMSPGCQRPPRHGAVLPRQPRKLV